MKRLLIFSFCLLLLLPVIASAQDTPATQLESFLAKKGSLLIKDSYNLGELPCSFGTKLSIDALVIQIPGNESLKTKGLRVEIKETGKYAKSHASFLDIEEIESLSAAILYMTKLMNDWKGTNREYTEVIFSTKGDFQIGFFQSGTEQTAFSSSGNVGKVTCFFNATTDLEVVKKLADSALEVLKNK